VNKNIHLLKTLYTEDRICAKKAGPGLSSSAFCAYLVVFATAQLPYLFVLCVGAPCFLFALRLMASKASPLCGVRRLHHVAGVFHVFVVTALRFSCSGDPRPLGHRWSCKQRKILSGFCKANEFEIGIQHMGTTQKVLYTFNKFVFGKKKFLCQ
jgi:hypothetical protein